MPSSSGSSPPRSTHLTPLGLFLKFCTSRVSSSFNLKKKTKTKGNAQAERPSTELRVKRQLRGTPLPRCLPAAVQRVTLRLDPPTGVRTAAHARGTSPNHETLGRRSHPYGPQFLHRRG